MKKIAAFICIILLCVSAFAAKPRTKAVVRRAVYVTDLDCEDCAKKIRENISFEKGVKDLKVDVEKRTVDVKFDAAKNDTLSLRKAMNKLGYSAKVVVFE